MPSDAPPKEPRPRRWRRRLAIAGAVLAVLVLGLYLASDVDTDVTDADRAAIASLALDDVCARASTSGFDAEVACVRALQARLGERVEDRRCAHVWGEIDHEPGGFFERGRGCCYDRSRVIEKALSHYGLEVRHGSLHMLNYPPPFGYAQSVRSHAFSEVRTSRGWMVVDSLYPEIGLDAQGRVYDAPALREILEAGREAELGGVFQPFYGGGYTVFYGLYSRHGGFFPPMVPVPDIDWGQLHYNL